VPRRVAGRLPPQPSKRAALGARAAHSRRAVALAPADAARRSPAWTTVEYLLLSVTVRVFLKKTQTTA